MQKQFALRHVFIIGAKSIGQYGGFETFVDMLIRQHQNLSGVKYHIACKANGEGSMDESKLSGVVVTSRNRDGSVSEFTYQNAHVFKIRCPKIGPSTAVYYDTAAVRYCIRYCKENHISHPVFYILACRIGPVINTLRRQIHMIGGTYMLNPDGHEWMRSKWSAPVQRYWKWSEEKMVRAADVVICDSVNIEKYIRKEYGHPNTAYISYGCDSTPSLLADDDPKYTSWLSEKGLTPGEYYLVVGRFVPENNYATMLREFIACGSFRSLALITNLNDRLKDELEKTLHFSTDARIKFVDTVYDRELLKKIRENAYGYLHGHEVGGTNPSLLEALGSTKLNLILDVSFNREVARDAAVYWTKDKGSLKSAIEAADRMDKETRDALGKLAAERVKAAYSWQHIGDMYEKLWTSGTRQE